MQQFKPNPQNTVHKQKSNETKIEFQISTNEKKFGSNQIFQSIHCRVAGFHFGTRKK